MDNNNNNYLSPDIYSASFEIMNEPLIHPQSINLVMPSIPSISYSIIHTSTVTTIKEHDNSSDCKDTHDDIANSNADLDLSIADSSNFMDIIEKNYATAQLTLVNLDRIEDKRTDLTPEEITHMMSKWPTRR